MTRLQCATTDDAAVTETVPLNAIPNGWDTAWADLANNASEPNPFAENWFLRPAARHLHPAREAHMLAVWQNNLLVGMLPLIVADDYGRIPVRHIENWLHYHCFFGAPLVRAGCETLFWAAALGHLDEARWAVNFLHLVCLDPNSAVVHALQETRKADIVHRSTRAMLKSDVAPETYFNANIRTKKRKEIKRLRVRLSELGDLSFTSLRPTDPIKDWIDQFLALEASGWKGREGSALADQQSTAAFFSETLSGAQSAGKLDMTRLTLNDKPIAMLVNFLTAPGGFAFKIAFDEDYARFSPGVLIKIDNLCLLNRPDILWTDSCAAADHPMINSLWAERREIARITVPLTGVTRQIMFRGSRLIETMAAHVRRRP